MIITQLIFLTKRKNLYIIYTESEVMKDMKYYCIDEKPMERLQNGTGICVKVIDINSQGERKCGYGIFDPQKHEVFLIKELIISSEGKPQEFYSTKFEEED